MPQYAVLYMDEWNTHLVSLCKEVDLSVGIVRRTEGGDDMVDLILLAPKRPP